MGLLGRTREWINRGLAPLNMRLETLTEKRAESGRLGRLAAAGHFDRPVFPVLRQFRQCDPSSIIEAVVSFEAQFARFDSVSDPTGYRFDNDYYQSPDAEVLYAMVRRFRPRLVVEIGSGNSTLLFRQVIIDGGMVTRLISIDPDPRRKIGDHSEDVIRSRVEDLADDSVFGKLGENDILFVDSSHEIKAGNDVLKLFLTIIPALAHGVIIHVHDVFLPYDYPRQWIVENRWNWTEQYLLHALLLDSDDYEVLWCGHYLQRTRPGILKSFKHWTGADAQSVWLRKHVGK